jgi:hypothetical protein
MPDLVLERRAARAAIDVGARRAAGEDPPLERCQPLPDLRARTIPRLPATHERLAGLEDERLHFLPAHAQHLSNFMVRVVAELEQHQRRALVSREPLQVFQHFA